MFKKAVIGVLVGLACLWVAKKTQVTSYASTLVAFGKQHVRKQIPRDVELARVQHEIEHLDRDYRGLLGPIAEKMASVKKLDREIFTAKENLLQQRESLLNLTKAVDGTHTLIATNGHTVSLDQAKVKLARDFATFKKLEAHLASREKLLEAETKSLSATQDQLEKLVVQKREFEIRLAQLEADEATLKVARIKAPLHTDSGRVADIKKTLERIAQGSK